MLSLVLLLSFVSLSAAAFEVPFEHDSFRMDGWDVDVSAFNISIGTPPQTIRVAFDTQASRGVDGAPSNLLVYTSNEVGLTVFNRSASNTFRKTAILYNDMNGPMGVIGRDVIQIGDKKKAGAEIHVSHETGSYYPLFHLNLATDGSSSFVSSLLEDEQVVTIVFDTATASDFNGTMTIGATDTKRCRNDWAMAEEADGDNQWMATIDEITVGAYTFDQPAGIATTIRFDGFDFRLPTAAHQQVCKALGVGTETLTPIDCKTTTELSFSVNGFDLKLQPADYINYKGEQYGDCYVTFYESGDDSATLPPGALRNHCLLFDYANFQVGLASKL